MSKQTTPEAFAAGRQTMESVYGATLLPPEAKAGSSPF
jgi:hypothetical protein